VESLIKHMPEMADIRKAIAKIPEMFPPQRSNPFYALLQRVLVSNRYTRRVATRSMKAWDISRQQRQRSIAFVLASITPPEVHDDLGMFSAHDRLMIAAAHAENEVDGR